MATLYRKYRPQAWEEVVGQNHIKITLQREIETGKLAHAFLFSGPRGIGKTTMARLLAKSVNCENRLAGKSEPCNKCSSCQEIAESRSIDVLEIDAASHTGVDNVRENIIDSARFLPTKNKFKVFIIDEAHMLSIGAFNALLKVLEEPPPHVLFVLATTELYKLPQTIVSRCQHFDYKKVNIDEIVKRLKMIADEEKIKVDKKVLEQVAYRSEGCLRDAESLLGQIFSLGEKNIDEEKAGLIIPRSSFAEAAKLLDLAAQKNLKEALIFLNTLVEEGMDLIRFTEDLVEFSRFLLLTKLGSDLGKISFALDENLLKIVSRLSAKFSLARIIEIIEIFLKQKTLLRSSPIPQLPLELALIMLCGENSALVDQSARSERSPSSLPVTKTDSPQAMAAENSISLDIIREKWENFLKKTQEYNHSLPLILRMGEPVGIRGRVIQIGVKYTFHREKLNEPKMRSLAEKALSEVLGQEARLEAVLADEINISKPETDEDKKLIESLVQAFGGQIVK